MPTAAITIMNLKPRGMGDAPAVPIQLYREWRVFEGLLGECLAELGFRLVLVAGADGGATDAVAADITAHSHATKRDVEGDLFYKQMHLRELFTIDTEGWGADHSAMRAGLDFEDADPAAAELFCRRLAHEFLVTGISKLGQPPLGSCADIPEDFIFVPTQVQVDYVNIHHSPISVPDFMKAVAAWGTECGENIVFKIHPGSRADREVADTVTFCRRQFPGVRFVDANVHELITRSAGVITINSGVGFESLIHGRPVVTLGNCDYRQATFNATVDTLGNAREYIRGFTPALLHRQRKFIYHYCHNHAYSIEPEQWWRSKARLRGYLESVLERVLKSTMGA